jgi:cytochrome bd-type quinol oxidase subunit 1
MTAELGRQPWLIHGLFRTSDGFSKVVSNGNIVFTLIGFTGLYFVLGLLFLFLVGRQISHGPDDEMLAGGKIVPNRQKEPASCSFGDDPDAGVAQIERKTL